MPTDSKPTKADFKKVEETIFDELATRKRKRKPLEANWTEIDRQIAMDPDLSFKALPGTGQADPRKAWMPEVELPLQSGALEILIADARRMTFPDQGNWYAAHAVMTDKYLERADLKPMIAGDDSQVPVQLNQENVDKIVQGYGDHIRSTYAFRDYWDQLHSEAMKYGAFVARGRVVKRKVFSSDLTGDLKSFEQEIPMMVPKSIKTTYLDDRHIKYAGEGLALSPSHIEEFSIKLLDIENAAKRGKSDPADPMGGWMPGGLKNVEGDKNGEVKLIKLYGDQVIPRDRGKSIFLENVEITMVAGDKSRSIVRFQTRRKPHFISHSYLSEDIGTVYGTSPLMKGRPVQKAAVDALTSFLAWAKIKVDPPIKYPAHDPGMESIGGPQFFPGARWPSIGKVEAFEAGEGGALWQAYLGFLQQYADTTGVNAPRIGAQTVSHTTAFAKDAELQRGVVRTVQYARSVIQNPLTRWLNIEYELGRESMRGNVTFFIPEYGGSVTISKSELPDDVLFTAFGSGGPQEDQARRQEEAQTLQLAISMEEAKRQLNPEATPMDLERAQTELLKDVFPNPEIFFAERPEGIPLRADADPGVQQITEGVQDSGLALLQAAE